MTGQRSTKSTISPRQSSPGTGAVGGAHITGRASRADEESGDLNELLLRLTANVVAAYLAKNFVATGDVGRLIEKTHANFKGLAPQRPKPIEDPQQPAVAIRKSMTNDYIICLEDGKKFKSLKRHLRTHFGLSPEQYREKWGLPNDYPMVAPSYSAKRSSLAVKSGLGRKP